MTDATTEERIIWRTRSKLARWSFIAMISQMTIMHFEPMMSIALADLVRLSILTTGGIVGWYMGMRTLDGAIGKGGNA